jgi:hypothetical protein
MGFFDDIGPAIGKAVHDVGKAVSDVEHDVEHVVSDAVDSVKHLIPPELMHYVDGVGDAIKWCAKAENEIAKDVGEVAKLAGKVKWGDVLHAVEAGVSVVPVIGTAVSGVLATAEVAVNAIEVALGGKNPIEFAIRTAYTYALGLVPGAAALRLILDTTVDALIRIAVGHENPTSAILHALVDDVPDKPKVGDLSPRSVAASLAKVVISHRPLVDVGIDLAAEATGAAGPVAERAFRAAAQCAKNGFKPEECVHAALDIAPVPAVARKAWDDVRGSVKALGSNLLPEDLAHLGAFVHDATNGVQSACEHVLGKLETDGAVAVGKMLKQGRDYSHITEVMGGVEGFTKGDVDAFLSKLPVERRATSEEIATLATTHATFKGHAVTHALPQRFVQAVIAAEPHRTIHIHLSLKGLAATPLDVLRTQLEQLR